MKKLLFIMVLFSAFNAQAQTSYDWEITPDLYTTWDVYEDSIRISMYSDNMDAFCDRYFLFIQDGAFTLSEAAPQISSDTAYIQFHPGYSNCGVLYPGMLGQAIIYRYPGWFNPTEAFRILYTKHENNLKILDIPEEPRFAMPALPAEAPLDASCGKFRTKGFLNFLTRNYIQFCMWTGTYAGGDAIFFKALSLKDSITLSASDIIILQGSKSMTLSFWSDNTTTAAAYCPDCSRVLPAGGSFVGVAYELPQWFDSTQPFIFQFQGQNFTVSNQAPCAAAVALGDDEAALASLRNFRDAHLSDSAIGRMLIGAYYRCSPWLTGLLERHPRLRSAARTGLKAVASALR
jgi:hypothetical protein